MTIELLELPRPGLDAPEPPIRSSTQRPDQASDGSATPAPDEVEAGSSWIGHVVLTVLSVLSLAPVAWMYLTSFRPGRAVFGDNPFVAPSVANYRDAFDRLEIGTLFAHTVAIAALVTIGQLVTSLLAAYAFARWTFRGRGLLFLAFVASWLVPFQVTMLPNYVLLSHFGLLNSISGVVVPQLSSAYAVILLRQHLKSFPTELLDAAAIDGRSSWSTLWRVVVPNVGPSLAALAILLFVSAWNEYFWPFLVYRDPRSSVLQLGLQSFLTAESLDYGGLMAASGLVCLPILVLYLFLQRRVVNAFVRSGLK